MDLAVSSGLMVRSTLGSGKTIKHTAKENLLMRMAITMKATGPMTKRLVVVFSNIQMGLFMMESGATTNSTARELRSSLTRTNMQANINVALKTVMVFILGLTKVFIKELGLKTKLPDMAFISGQMVASMKASGMITTCMASAFTTGLMDVCIQASS